MRACRRPSRTTRRKTPPVTARRRAVAVDSARGRVPDDALSAPAAPEMLDPNFSKTVVVMGHHTREGALGWIVNRLLDQPERRSCHNRWTARCTARRRSTLAGPPLRTASPVHSPQAPPKLLNPA